MRIKKIHIINFAGINNKTIDFEEGFNLIYGENESGKSSIENFIKIWLYGIEQNEENKYNRNDYMPLNGKDISGELTFYHKGRNFIIKRVFGVTKEKDTCNIIDEDTGQEIKLKYNNEPGKSILNINYSCFVRSLFIERREGFFKNQKKSDFTKNTGDISIEVLKNIENNYKKYMKDLEQKNINLERINYLENKNKELIKIFNLYRDLDSMGNGLYEKLFSLKDEQRNIEKLLKEYENNQNFIYETKKELVRKAANVNSIEFIGKYRQDIEKLLHSYKYSLKELKYRIENQSKHKLDRNKKDAKKKLIFTNIKITIVMFLFMYCIMKKYLVISITCIPVILILIKKSLKYSIIIRNNKIAQRDRELIQDAKNKVDENEEEINIYMKETDSCNYEEFVEKITEYDKYISYKENSEKILKKKEKEFNVEKINSLKNIFDENSSFIDNVLKIIYSDNLEDGLKEIKKYEDVKRELELNNKNIKILKLKNKELEEKINRLNIEIEKYKNILHIHKNIIGEEFLSRIKEAKNDLIMSESFSQINELLGEDLNSKTLDKYNKITSGNFTELVIEQNYYIKLSKNKILYNVENLSNAGKEQLIFSASISLAEVIFKDKKVPILLNCPFIEYDDDRRKRALKILIDSGFNQVLLFTCQNIEKSILDFMDKKYNYIRL
ncbi:ATP-binding protein [uncultured Clostridium sp.]|uniref:ATP-binding protein n=1 Tax=uncultured Clostridium sp. TaxID=59620 RepID=UPI0025CF3173|nr:AAA family ATPase [uncultured Clostridium sp.]